MQPATATKRARLTASVNSVGIGDVRGESALPLLEFSIAQLRDEAAQPVAVAWSTRAAAAALLVTCFSRLVLRRSVTLEMHGFTSYSFASFAWLAV
jgi:hypothetical protein